jgi:hypothetical protein
MPRLLVAVMYSDKDLYQKAKTLLSETFGVIILETEAYDFDQFTCYYEKEMGKNLLKRFLIFKMEIRKKDLVEIKHQTTEIEKEYAKDNKRTINLDPGYLSKKELVLASFKKGTNYKENLSQGIYAHKVLEFGHGEVKIFWHTFPDYRKNAEFLKEISQK